MAKKSLVPKELRKGTSPYRAQNLGHIAHPFDQFSEENNEQERKAIIAALQWVKNEVPTDELLSMAVKKRKKSWEKVLDPANGFLELENLPALKTAKKAYHKKNLVKYFGGDLYYAVKDLLAKRKVKTSLLVASGIILGAVLGIAFGTIILPSLAMAVGGTMGVLIAGALGAAGGGIGLGIMGAFFGTVLSSKLATKIFKQENKYQLSKRITNDIESKIGINANVAQLINGYLYNRQQAISSPLCKQYYKIMRAVAIGNANPRAMEKVTHFFIHEYYFLKKACQASPLDQSLAQEFAAVTYILSHCQKARGLSIYTREIIDEVLKKGPSAGPVTPANEVAKTALNVAIKHSSMVRQSEAPGASLVDQAGLRHVNSPALAKGALKEIHQQYLPWARALPEVKNIEYLKSSSHRYKKYQYKITTGNNEKLPEISLYRWVEPHRRYTQISVADTKHLTPAARELVARLLIEQSRLYGQKIGLPPLKIQANGDEKLAVHLLAQGFKHQLVVELDDTEFPSSTAEEKAKRADILEQAQRLVGIKSAHPVRLKDPRLKNG